MAWGMVPFLGPVFQLKWDGICGGGVSLSNFYMRCSRKARSLLSLSPVGEVAHFAIRANLHIDALTMLKDAWQCIVGCCVPCFFLCAFLVASSHLMSSWRDRAKESKQFSMATDIFDCTWVDLSDLFSFRLFLGFFPPFFLFF